MSDPNNPPPPPAGPDFNKDQGAGTGSHQAYGGQVPSYAQQPPGYEQQPAYGEQPSYSQGQQPGYGQQPAYGQTYGDYATGPRGPGKGLAIAALVLGIVALLGSWIPLFGFFFAFLGVIAIGLGVAGAVQASKGRAGGKGMAIAGAVLGAVSIVLSIVAFILFLSVMERGASAFEDEMNSFESSIAAPEESTEDILANNLDVEFSQLEITGDTNFPDTRLPVTLTNTGSTPASFTVSLSAVSGGIEVDSDFVSTGTLQPGASETQDTFELALDAEELSTATFEVVDVTMYDF